MKSSFPRVYIPFGDGCPRVCIGRAFAVMEATSALATIIQKFQLDTLSEYHEAHNSALRQRCSAY
ncbi:cytochrome P450 [Scytonema sp. PCC 10023]|uniref:cytochrome P450 n=1 Tax=Scytonema sp. PCC 10023 TaxID=1680591 RepID=UPI0039C641D8